MAQPPLERRVRALFDAEEDMDLFGFINRGVALNSAQPEPAVLLTATAEVIAEMMGIDAADVPREAETNPALDDLGDGVFRVWSGKRSNANVCGLPHGKD